MSSARTTPTAAMTARLGPRGRQAESTSESEECSFTAAYTTFKPSSAVALSWRKTLNVHICGSKYSLCRVSTSTSPSVGVGVVLVGAPSMSSTDGDSAGEIRVNMTSQCWPSGLREQQGGQRRTVGRAHPGCNLGNGTAQDLDLSGSPTVPAQRLQPNKASHRGGEDAVENPEVAVGVGPEYLGTIATNLTVYHWKHNKHSKNPQRLERRPFSLCSKRPCEASSFFCLC